MSVIEDLISALPDKARSALETLVSQPSWLQRAQAQDQALTQAYQGGGMPGVARELYNNPQQTADLAGGFAGTTYRAYHGTGAPITGDLIAGHPYRYDPGFMGAGGIYSTNQVHLANDYAMLKAAKETNPAPNVIPLNLEMNNPLTINVVEKKRLSGLSQPERDQWLQNVYASGHDGVIVKYGDENPNRRTSGYEEYLAPAKQYSSIFNNEPKP